MTDLILDGLLSDSERERLGALEDTIRRGLQSFMEAGRALAEVRNSRLYRAEFASFEDYCQERWGFNRHRASQLINAVAVVTNVTSQGLPAPTNEGQARELARVPEGKQADVWREALKRADGKPTATVVRNVQGGVAPRPVAPVPPQPPAPRPDFAPNRPPAEPSRPAATPSAPGCSEPSTVDGAEATEPPLRADASFAPSEPGRVSDSDRAALNAFINSDQAIQLASWRTSFMTAIGRMASITEFKPDDVAVKADQQLIDELQAAHRHLGNYIDRINAQRPSGLRLVQKG